MKKQKKFPFQFIKTGPKSQRSSKLGKAPGTVTYIGHRKEEKSRVNLITYDDSELIKQQVEVTENMDIRTPPLKTQWFTVIGLSDEVSMGRLASLSGLNPLVMEDIVNTESRPKVEEYDDHIFVVLKMLYPNGSDQIVKEHIALILQPGRVFLYQEIEDDVFDGVRGRLEQHSGRIRSRGSDYLFFALIDAVVDHYFIILEALEMKLESLERVIYTDPKPETVYEIQQLRNDILKIRKWMAPVRELVMRLIETESELISKDTRVFLRDILDHSIEINETLHIQREMAFGLMELYMSHVSNKMNQVMKVLTIMASIFIPLTFIAGIYGMNFKNMPELEWHYGYFGILGIMFLVFILLVLYFKRKDWL
ncbi:MAG: magnesium/cobalt transporter CorA [Robiginitalea sp.]|uniref:magnesium/cobalt transporter CorA n=1 Tax=Robiginitalea sp. TaxID=1902411 RepID=UPI003C791353